MATITVTNLDDSGAGSLREALAASADGDTITFAPSLAGTIALQSGLSIHTDVGIVGPIAPDGAPAIVLDGQNGAGVSQSDGGSGFAILTVSTSDSGTGFATAAISNIGFANGYDVAGSTVQRFFTYGDAAGGAIINEGQLSLVNDSFINDRAVGGVSSGAAGGIAGGAILNSGSLTVTSSTFIDDAAQGGNSALGELPAGDGGAAAGAVMNGYGGVGVPPQGPMPTLLLDLATTFFGDQAVGGEPSSASGNVGAAYTDYDPNGTTVACYCVGTRIATPDGEIVVEALSIGDLVLTQAGMARPVRWIGRRSYDGRFAFGNRDILPVRIKAGALANGVPHRDLQVSPLHAMALDGMLIPAVCLVNGISIVQANRIDRVDYVHVELETHDVILAEGAAAESFVDDDSRAMFHNAHEFHALYPDMPRQSALYCHPRVEDGPALEAVRRRIKARTLYAAIGSQQRVG